MNIRQEKIENEHAAILSASLLAGFLLAAIYNLLALSAMKESALLHSAENGVQILSEAGNMSWGSAGRILCGMIFLIACLNVCASLLACTSEYFSELAPKLSYRSWLLAFTLIGAITACTGLNAVLSWSGKVLSLICPIAILILAVSLILYFVKGKQETQKSESSQTIKQ